MKYTPISKFLHKSIDHSHPNIKRSVSLVLFTELNIASFRWLKVHFSVPLQCLICTFTVAYVSSIKYWSLEEYSLSLRKFNKVLSIYSITSSLFMNLLAGCYRLWCYRITQESLDQILLYLLWWISSHLFKIKTWFVLFYFQLNCQLSVNTQKYIKYFISSHSFNSQRHFYKM